MSGFRPGEDATDLELKHARGEVVRRLSGDVPPEWVALALAEQEMYEREVTLRGGVHKRGEPVTVCGVGVGAEGEQEAGDVEPTPRGGVVQRLCAVETNRD